MAEEEKREIIGIDLDLFPEFSGDRYPRSLYLGKEFSHKLTCNLPIPENWSELCQFYGIDEAAAKARLVAAISTDRDTATRNYINKVKNNIEWENPDQAIIDEISKLYMKDLTNPPEKKVSETKKVKSVLSKYGLSAEELDEVLAQMKAKKGKK